MTPEEKVHEDELNERNRQRAEEWRARREANRNPMPDGLTRQEQNWFNTIDGVTSVDGVVVHTSRTLLNNLSEATITDDVTYHHFTAGQVVDAVMRPSQIVPGNRPDTMRYIGEFATVTVNTQTGTILNGHRTNLEELTRIHQTK